MNDTPKKNFPRPRPLFAAVFIAALALDQLVKQLVVRTMSLGESRAVIPGFFNLTYVRNDGIAFGFLQGNNFLMGLIALVILGAGLWWARQLDWKKTEVNLLAALIISGAVGNLIDRWSVGHVIDFLDFHWKTRWAWPAFNVADACISMSITYLFFRLLWPRHKKE
ncbi:MAG: signal peptidase II [bacterium]